MLQVTSLALELPPTAMLYGMALTHRILPAALVLAMVAALVLALAYLAPDVAPRATAATTSPGATTTAVCGGDEECRSLVIVPAGAVPEPVWQELLSRGYHGLAGDHMEAIYVPANVLAEVLGERA